MKNNLKVCYELGQIARITGQPVSSCTLRRHDRIAAWQRGWNDADLQMVPPRAITEKERVAAKNFLQTCYSILRGGA